MYGVGYLYLCPFVNYGVALYDVYSFKMLHQVSKIGIMVLMFGLEKEFKIILLKIAHLNWWFIMYSMIKLIYRSHAITQYHYQLEQTRDTQTYIYMTFYME